MLLDQINTFELIIGESYVYGIMDGLAVNGPAENDPPLPDNTLPRTDWHGVYLV